MAAKRRMRTRTKRNTEDRLSSLHDDILIGILSRLPLHLAIITGSLSCRWRNLWTKITSINVGSSYSKYLPEIMKQITSPLIHSFCIEYDFSELTESRTSSAMTRLICKVCNRNVRELKITCPQFWSQCETEWPGIILRTQSLVSLDLGLDLQLPVGSSPINLPNLKSLTLVHSPDDYESLGTVIEACPSLEELSLTCPSTTVTSHDFKCSNPNIRRLFIKSLINGNLKVVINAPKLEYFSICARNYMSFCFEKEPIELHEAKVNFIDHNYPPSQDELKVISNLYTAFHNAMFLTLRIFGQQKISRVYSNATQLTLSLQMRYDNIKAVLSFLELCPALEVLKLHISYVGIENDHGEILSKPAILSTSLQVLRRLEIKVNTYNYHEPSKSFLELVEYLLSSAIHLKYLRLTLVGDNIDDVKESAQDFRRELEFCKLLYRFSKGCEVEYIGKLVNMSGESGSKIWKVNDNIIAFI